MPTRELLSPAQRAALLAIPPDLTGHDLAHYYTLSAEELALVQQRRRPHNRLGFAVQLAYLRFPGRPWEADEVVPAAILQFLATQVGESAAVFGDYAAARDPTRREHLLEIQRHLGYRAFDGAAYRALSAWLLPLALSTEDGVALVEALLGELRRRKISLPALSTVERLAWETRRRARRQIWTRLTDGLTAEQHRQLDTLLVVPPAGRRTPLAWLREPPGPAKPSSFLKVIERLQSVRDFHLEPALRQRVHARRLRQLAREGERYTPQFLARFEPPRRYATLVAFLLETGAQLTDTALEMHDRMIGMLFTNGQKAHHAQFEQRGKAINEKVRLYADIGKALIAARAEERDPFTAIQAVVPWETFVSSVDEAVALARPDSFDYLDLLAPQYPQVRKYAPVLLDVFTFHAAPAGQAVVDALALVRELGRKKVPATAPTSFVKPRWEPYVFTDAGVDRRYYELCALAELRSGLRSGDIWVEGSHQYKDFDAYLLPSTAWQEMQAAETVSVALPADGAAYLADRTKRLHEQLTRVAALLAANKFPGVRMGQERLHLTPLEPDIPEGVEELTQHAYAKVRRVKITDLLVDVDAATGFSRHFTHLHTGDRPADHVALFANLLAEATNLGLTKMAAACPGMTAKRLVWVADWYLRDECFTKALADLINFQHGLPFALHWGDGTTSSSDGQHFPVGGRREATARINAKYGREPTLLYYTHLSDQHGPYHTKVISGTAKKAPYLVDGLLDHETALEIREHYADTGGYTDQIFGICALLGFRFAPRLRDLGDRKLYPIEKPGTYPQLESLIGGAINVKQITTHWDELRRLTASLRLGTVTASLMLRKLASYPRQNGLAWALREIGRIEKTLFILEWLQSEELRRRVQIGLNKGEGRNALARAVAFYRRGLVQDRSYADQQQRAQGLNLVVAAIILWNTLALDRAIVELRAEGMEITDAQLQHVSPMEWEHIGLTGDYTWEALAQHAH